jgi:PHD/YefM family antitoxin component YafN of YafNO toxin-antitoxin module
MGEVRVSNEELFSVRDAMRGLNRLVERLERGESDKIVLTQQNQMRAVVVSVEGFSRMQRRLEDLERTAHVTLSPPSDQAVA